MNSYKIVYSDRMYVDELEQVKNLEEKVQILIAQGWSCIGGVVASFMGEGRMRRIYQTMVKSAV